VFAQDEGRCGIGSLRVHAGNDVAVDLECERGRRMAEPLADYLGGYARSEHAADLASYTAADGCALMSGS
jgi:hypothetical protein